MNFRLIFLALWAIWAAYWFVSAFGNKRTVYRTNSLWRIGLLLVVVGVVTASQGHPGFFHRRLYLRTDATAACGAVLCALGIAFSIWARAILGRNWSGTPTIKESHELVQTGPYSLARHPIYTGLILAIFGTCLSGGRLEDLIMFLGITVMLVIKLRIEEGLMLQQFPEAYPEFRKRTKALIPFLF